MSVASASLTSGSGAVSSSAIGPNPNQYSMNLIGVTNGQYITATLTNVHDAAGTNFDVSRTMGTANGVVSNTDVSGIKAQVGAPVTSSNFRNDVSTNGIISNIDVSTTKGQVGTTLP